MKSIKGARGTGPGAYLLYLLLIGLLVSGCGELKNEDARNSGGNVSLVFSIPGSGGPESNKTFNKYVYQSFSSITVEIYSNNVLWTRDAFNVTQGTDATREYDIDPGTGWTFIATAFSGGRTIYNGQVTTDIPEGEDVTVRIPMVATDVTQQLVDDLNTSLNEFKNFVNSKGASLTQADLLPFFDPAYFDSGSNVNDETADMASDMPGLSGVYLYEILNYDQPNGIIDFQLQYWGSKNGTYESGVMKQTFKNISGAWVFYGNQRPARTEFYYGVKTVAYADGRPTESFARVDTHFEAYSGTVKSIAFSAPFINGTSIVQSGCGTWLNDNGKTMEDFCQPPINMIATPRVGDSVDYEVTLTNTSTVSYSQVIGFVNATTGIVLTSPTGHYLDDAKLGSQLNVTWTNPFPDGRVEIRGRVCDVNYQCTELDGTITSAYSGHVTIPDIPNILDAKIKVSVHFRGEASSNYHHWFSGWTPPAFTKPMAMQFEDTTFNNAIQVNDLKETSDGGYIVSGDSDLFTSTRVSGLLMKLDSDFNLQWQSSFGNISSDVWTYSVDQTSDGGYVAAGEYWNYGSMTGPAASVTKFNSSGNISWQKGFGNISSPINVGAIHQTSDGGYVVGGTAYSNVTFLNSLLVIKLDASGNIVWQSTYGDGVNDVWGSGDIKQTSDGGFIYMGQGNGSLLKLDSAGNIQWQKAITSALINTDLSLFSLDQTADGGYLIGGGFYNFSTYMDSALVMKLDSTGAEVWSKSYGNGFSSVAGGIARETTGGEIIYLGEVMYEAGDDGLVMKLDSTGNIIWQNMYNYINQYSHWFYPMIVDSRDEIVVADRFRFDSTDIFMGRIDTNGRTEPCAERGSPALVASSIAVSSTTGTYVKGNPNLSPVAFTLSSQTPFLAQGGATCPIGGGEQAPPPMKPGVNKGGLESNWWKSFLNPR